MTQVKKRLSKKTKGSWRKIEHQDVDNYLEDQRLEERMGKVSDKTNDELFVVDTEPTLKKKKKKIGLTLREKRKKLLKSTPKCFASLLNDSKVSDPIAKRNRVRTKEERRHFIAKSLEQANEAKGIVKKKVLRSLSDRARSLEAAAAKQKANKQAVFDKDIWEMGTAAEQRTDFKNDWIEDHVVTHNIVNTGTPVVSVPSSAFHKRSKLKAVQVPHPGTSYNPSLKDHQALLEQVKERELKIIKQEDHLNRVTTEMFKKVSSGERDTFKLNELRSGLDDEETNEIVSDHDEYIAINPPVEVKRKDRKARRKQKEQRELQLALQKKKQLKKQTADLHRLKKLTAEIKVMEKELNDQREKKKEREEKKREEPHRLSKFSFEEEEIDINMPEEISGNLRNITPHGSILTDRYKSMQKRNIIATSKDLGLRKRRDVKRYTRNSHKEEIPQPVKSKKKRK
ncbi:ribosome biogenesis protein NOP53 [Contarinia nasturtii]|uniref:ribosome biogenesis protein NOP53 n=1 Tax=Contarinia nasturtii TaxID=265458 RepID=UPI0012D3F1D1|nr:ribosome biogenesis protein NOP53 [Contarinia nasturtii]